MKRGISIIVCLLAVLAAGAQNVIESQLGYRRFTTHDGMPQMQAETVWQDSRGYIYIGTLSGFVRFDGRKLTPFLTGRRENIVGFQEVGGGIRAMHFLRQWLMDGDELTMEPIDALGDRLLNNFNAADLPNGYVILEDRQELNRRLCQIEPDGIKIVMKHPLLDEMTPDRKLYIDSGRVYVPTATGLYTAPLHLTDGGEMRRVTDKGDIFSLIRVGRTLYALAIDGIYTMGGDSLTLLCEHRFEAPDYGLSTRHNSQGQLFIADSHTIWLYDDGKMRQLATGFNLIKGLFVDKWNRLWAATYQGAYCFFHCNFVNHRLTDRNDIVRAIAADPQGHMVMGTLNGKVIVDGRVISDQPDNFFAPSAAVVDGKVYMAAGDDVASVQGGDTLRWAELPCDRYQFVAAQGERLIIGTRRSLLAWQPEAGRLDTLTEEIFRPYCAADDGGGRLWVAGNTGLYCIAGDSVRKVKGTHTSLVVTAISSNRGQVFFALGDSLFTIRGDKLEAVGEALPTLAGHEIRTLHVSTHGCLTVAAIDGMMVARIEEGNHLSDIHWFNAENGFTMIEPLMSTMAETADGTVWLAGLEEMTSFRPEELLADNQEQAVVMKPKPWWQRWWAILLGCLLTGMACWRMARWYEQRRTKRKMLALAREKKLKELQLSAVRLKAIPHFHSNVLAGIEYFVMNNSTDEATHYLKLYSDFTNQTLSDIDRPARTVAEEASYVRTYLQLEQMRYGDRLQYTLSVAPDVDQNSLLPTMLIHTYCQNAVKHGIGPKAGGGHIAVAVSNSRKDGAEGVLVSVTDDGVGRSEAALHSKNSTKQGLRILLEQTGLYNQTNRHKIVQRVIDLTDAAGKPAGTRFEMWVPKDYEFRV